MHSENTFIGKVTVTASRWQRVDLRLSLSDGQHLDCEIVGNQVNESSDIMGEGLAALGVELLKGMKAMEINGVLPPLHLHDPNLAAHLRLRAADVLSAMEMPGARDFAIRGLRADRNCLLLDVDFRA